MAVLGGDLVVLQAPMFDGLLFDDSALCVNLLIATEEDGGRPLKRPGFSGGSYL